MIGDGSLMRQRVGHRNECIYKGLRLKKRLVVIKDTHQPTKSQSFSLFSHLPSQLSDSLVDVSGDASPLLS